MSDLLSSDVRRVEICLMPCGLTIRLVEIDGGVARLVEASAVIRCRTIMEIDIQGKKGPPFAP